EQRVADAAACSFFVTDNEVALFRALSPCHELRLAALGNGVDADFFTPDAGRASPFASGELPLVFTGAMDYWPNVDAVTWFASSILPALRERFPALRFHIVGRSPAPAVQALAGDAIHVTGTVPDVRPYLQHAAAVVAPLRLARGIQNKVLADAEADYVERLGALLADPEAADAAGQAARDFVLGAYSWDAHLAGLDRHLEIA
ncbi:MAG: glycosyltransferase, partial [Burkholderiales bacterium]|nr:glycosyltransferase [Burkholderiales bacterium]